MRRLFFCILMCMLSLTLMVHEASAKRFGGGRSFGVQRSHSSLSSGNSFQKSSSPLGSLGNKAKKMPWGGILGGIIAGGLISSLLMGNGLAQGMMSWLVIGGIALMLFAFLRKKMQPAQSAYQASGGNSFDRQAFTSMGASQGASSSEAFDKDDFLRQAKISFIRLQAAYDQKNLQDLNAFTAPEVFAEVKMQLDERGDAPNKTEVMHLEAELLDISKQAVSVIASVRFTGMIKENEEAETALDEIWHFYQFSNNSTWVVGGIQQEVNQV